MRDCHLVAYRQAGFNPVAIASRNPNTAQAVADRHHIPSVHVSIDGLLADTEIEILDIAVPPDAQPATIRRAAKQKHLQGILAQKPLPRTVAESKECIQFTA